MSTPTFVKQYSMDEFKTMDYNELRQYAKELSGVDGRSPKDEILERISDEKERLGMAKKKVTSLTTRPTPVVTDHGNYPLRKGQSVECEEVKNADELGNSVRIEELSDSSSSSSTSLSSDSEDETEDSE